MRGKQGMCRAGRGALLAMLLAAAQGAGGGENLLPPEVIRQMDPDVLSGRRPRVAVIRREDLFGLRERPVQAADFVQLDLEPRDLSTVERRVVEEWLQSGSDRVLLRGEDMLWYAEFFGLEGLGRRRGYWPLTMKDHEVNTDCTDVEVDQVLTSVPAGATVIATAGGYPACGAFDFGLTRVLFFDDAHGNDSRRWYLNFMHWALGLKVPGGADIRVQTAGAAGATEASGLDGVRLKGGDSLTGSVLNESFVVVSPYATLKLEKGAIERMSLSGDGSSPDVIHLRGGDKVSGSLGDVRLRLKLGSDEIVEIERGKIAEVRFRPAP